MFSQFAVHASTNQVGRLAQKPGKPRQASAKLRDPRHVGCHFPDCRRLFTSYFHHPSQQSSRHLWRQPSAPTSVLAVALPQPFLRHTRSQAYARSDAPLATPAAVNCPPLQIVDPFSTRHFRSRLVLSGVRFDTLRSQIRCCVSNQSTSHRTACSSITLRHPAHSGPIFLFSWLCYRTAVAIAPKSIHHLSSLLPSSRSGQQPFRRRFHTLHLGSTAS